MQSMCMSDKKDTESKSREKLPKIKIGVDMLKPFFYIDQNGDGKTESIGSVRTCIFEAYGSL